MPLREGVLLLDPEEYVVVLVVLLLDVELDSIDPPVHVEVHVDAFLQVDLHLVLAEYPEPVVRIDPAVRDAPPPEYLPVPHVEGIGAAGKPLREIVPEAWGHHE